MGSPHSGFEDVEDALVGVEFDECAEGEGDRVRDVAAGVADEGGAAERRQLVPEHGLEGEVALPLLVRGIPAEGADEKAGRALEQPGPTELRQVALDPGGGLVDILEEEDAVGQVDLLRGAER